MTQLLTTPELAKMLGLAEQTIRIRRIYQSDFVPYIRLGGPRGPVRYRLEDVEAWLAAKTFKSTSEETCAAGV